MASQNQPVIAFIGAGNMAEAILGGLYAKRATSQLGRLRFSEPVKERCEYMCNKFPKAVSYGSDNNACIDGADVVVLAVKPQVMRKVVQALQVQDPNVLIISIAAGIRTSDIQRWINSKNASTAVVRCMPNTPALIGEGAAGLYATDAVSESQRATAEAILKSIGKQVVWVEDEKHIDTVTGISGSGPAYFFLFMEAMSKSMGIMHVTTLLIHFSFIRGSWRRIRLISRGSRSSCDANMCGCRPYGTIIR